MLAILFGQAIETVDISLIIYSVIGLFVYILLFLWYFKAMKKQNVEQYGKTEDE